MWRLAIGVAAAVLSLQLLPAECKTFQITKELSIGTSLCPGQPNTNVPWTGTPTLVKEVANGSLYTVGEDDDLIYVLHVYGTPYDMGYAHGTLLKDSALHVMTSFYNEIVTEYEQNLNFLPKDVADLIARLGVDGALDLTYLLTERYTPAYFYEEMRGLADASGIDYILLRRVHMIPELIKAGCSMLGAWGSAIVDPLGMLQVRALDFDTTASLQDAPTVVVYHPDEGNVFANVGWAGWIASISGMSSKGIAMSEKHGEMPFGEESRVGIPFNFLIRDILQFDDSLEDALWRIQEAHRTCSIWLGVGDGNMKAFRLVEYSYSTFEIFDDKNVTKVNESRFNTEGCNDTCYQNYAMSDLAYWGVHLGCWNEVLRATYGSLSPATVIQLLGLVQTGDLHAIVYDLAGLKMYVSNARAVNEAGPDNAYDRKYVELDMSQLFQVPKPSLVRG
ncbi:hypothetical protein EMCRGX_G024436 [Ephydatia muelleri]|eukprot:Em0015g620a